MVLSPLCDKFVARLPMWLAPNLITLTGFAFNIVPFMLVFALYGNTTEGPIDWWFCIMMAVCFFIYNFLDNCDGKQARRTGSGSPMGMLFDHGCDALTTVICNILMQRMFQVGSGWYAILSMAVSTFPAYYLIFEEFYLGTLVLPNFSGPDDLSLYIIILCSYSAYYGSEEVWGVSYNFFGLQEMRMSHLFMYALLVIEVGTVVSGVCTNIYQGRKTEHFKKRFEATSFMLQFSFMISLSAIFLGYEMVPGALSAKEYPRLATLAFGGQYLQAQLRMILAGVSGEQFMPYRRTMMFSWCLMATNAISLMLYKQTVIDEFLMYITMNVLAWGAIFHFIYYSLNQLMAICNTRMFKITPKI